MSSAEKLSKTWDRLTPDYEQLVFNVFESDRNQLLIKSILKIGNKNKTAGDFGCGIGRALPLLSDRFKKVFATDFSRESIKAAASLGIRNVIFGIHDLSKPNLRLPKVDFALCVNVAISAEVKKDLSIIENVCSALKKKGTALFVIPSWESTSLVTWRTMQLHKKDGHLFHEIPSDDLQFYEGKGINIESGVFNVDGAPTKHWLISEIMQAFKKPGITIESIDKIEYDWQTELATPPSWLAAPYPWDWLVRVKRK